MRIAVIGAGGVGGYFGAQLADAGTDVVFLARGAHLAAMRDGGLHVQSPGRTLHLPHVTATDDSSTIGPVDVVFFTVKLYDTESALALLPPLVGNDTVVVPFQNGVDSVDRLSSVIDPSHVAGGTSYVAAVIAEPGVIRHTAMGSLIFGELDGSRSLRLQRLLDACEAAGIAATLTSDITAAIWSKFVHLSVFSGMTAVTRSSVGPLRDDADLLAMWQAAVLETMAVAHAKGIALPGTLFADIAANLQSLPPQARSSMLEDLERGRRLELPWLSGTVVRMGRELGVDTPIHRFIATVLAPHSNGRQA